MIIFHKITIVQWWRDLRWNLKIMGSIPTWVTFDTEIDQSLLKGCGFESRQVYFNYPYIQSTNNTLTSQIESYGRHIWQQSQGFVNSIYRFPIFICALSPGPLRRMQLSNAYTLRRVYSVPSDLWQEHVFV